ncbi:hypothetical protein ACISU4_16355 [Streptomyces wuyuanensis]|uniref:hypothetical protein n=1 Tax=Streptomyces wuyuanensis TaxID=1196353 RepID=UPI003822D241
MTTATHAAEPGRRLVKSPWSRGFYLPVMESVLDPLKPERPQGHIMSAAPFLFTFPGEERAYGPGCELDTGAFEVPADVTDG